MDIKEMKYFVEVCRYNSILKASQKLYITQQALSKAMKKLEFSLGVELFTRSTNSISLTQEGEYLYEKVTTELERHRLFCQDLEKQFRTKTTVLRLGVVPGALRTLGADVLMGFFEKNKGVKLEITETYDKICEQMIRENKLDIAISTRPIDGIGLTFTKIKREKLFVIANKKYPIANRETLSFDELNGIPIVLCDDNLNLHTNVMLEFQRNKQKPNIVFEANEIEIMIDLVAKGRAINICAEHVCYDLERKGIVAIPIRDTLADWEIGTLVLAKEGKDKLKEKVSILELLHAAGNL